MKSYFLTVFGVAILAGVAEVAAPEGEGGGLKKAIRALCSLILLAVLILPLRTGTEFSAQALWDTIDSLLSGEEGSEEERYREQFGAELFSAGVAHLEEGIAAYLTENFAIPADECSVIAECGGSYEKIEVGRVRILLSGSSVFRDPYKIEKAIGDLLGCECIVAIG